MKLNYAVLGTKNLQRASCFYDALFADAEIEKISPCERMTYWLGQGFAFALAIPFDGQEATHGNGSMLGFCVGGPADVTAFYQKALTLGGTCEGSPSQRGPKFSAYVRDLDNNKLCFSD